MTAAAGDAYARCEVRLKEILQSFRLIREAIDKIPEGPVSVPVKGNPKGNISCASSSPGARRFIT